jgi:ferritin
MLSEKMTKALNGQANRNFIPHLYLSMSAYFESINMKGFASWMRVQAGEELVHGMKLYDYDRERRRQGKMLAIEASVLLGVSSGCLPACLQP